MMNNALAAMMVAVNLMIDLLKQDIQEDKPSLKVEVPQPEHAKAMRQVDAPTLLTPIESSAIRRLASCNFPRLSLCVGSGA